MEKQNLIDFIIDLLTEFDEMGFAPTTTVPDPEAYAIEWRNKITNALADYRKQEWISVEERLPDPEVEVLIFAVGKYVCKGERWERPIITTAMYENGKVTTEESDWSWYDLDFVYDEENDCCYIPEGWWEYRHYNPDDVYNCAVDDKVLYWMPLPDPPKGVVDGKAD